MDGDLVTVECKGDGPPGPALPELLFWDIRNLTN
jgi:hypothetical protein